MAVTGLEERWIQRDLGFGPDSASELWMSACPSGPEFLIVKRKSLDPLCLMLVGGLDRREPCQVPATGPGTQWVFIPWLRLGLELDIPALTLMLAIRPEQIAQRLWVSASLFINGENHGSSLLRFGGRLNYNVSVSDSLACSVCLIEVSSGTMEGKHFITIPSKSFQLELMANLVESNLKHLFSRFISLSCKC